MAVHVDMDAGVIKDGIISLPEYKTKRVKNYRDLYGEVGKPSLKLAISKRLGLLNVYAKSIKAQYFVYTPEGRELEASLKNKVYIKNFENEDLIFLIDEDYKNKEIKLLKGGYDHNDMLDIINTADRIEEKKFKKIISKASNKSKIEYHLERGI